MKKLMLHYIVSAGLLVLITTSLVQAQKTGAVWISENSMQAIHINGNHISKLTINPKTGIPKSIVFDNTKSYAGTAETAARDFLTEHASLFSLKENLEDLTFQRTTINKHGLKRSTFTQTHSGIPIYGAELKVQQLPDGTIAMVNGFYHPEINIEITPFLTAEQAVNSVKAHSDIEIKAQDSGASELMIFPKNDGDYALTWKVYINSTSPFIHAYYYVNAHTGAIVKTENLLMDAVISMPEEINEVDNIEFEETELSLTKGHTVTTGSGNIYPTYPGDSSVSQEDLYRLDNSGYLRGTYVKVVNDVANEAYSVSNNFYYHPEGSQNFPASDSTHFDEVNIYYHIDNFRHDFIENLQSSSLPQITAHAHSNYNPGPNNAWFDTMTDEVYFGDGPGAGFYPFAHEAKVIYHEYGHAIIHEIQSGIESSNDEEGAISEGIPDYFAGAYTNNSQILNYAIPAYIRDMNNPILSSYSDYENERDNELPIGIVAPHQGGEFFSALLWDLRDRSGITTSETDYLVLDALGGLSADPDFIEFRDAMLTSDQAAYSGSHKQLINQVFYDWGFYTEVSGTISSNTTWSGSIRVTGNITANASLTILPGTVVYVNSGKSITFNDDFDVNNVLFKPVSGSWSGITINSGADGRIENSTIQDIQKYGGAGISIYSNSNVIELENNTLTDFTGAAHGIYVSNSSGVYIYDNKIEDVTQSGVSTYNSSVYIFDNFIKNFDVAGVDAGSYSNVVLGASTTPNYNGENSIIGGKYGLRAGYQATITAGSGAGYGDDNRVLNQDASGWKHIRTTSSSATIYARRNYWKPVSGSGGVAPSISGNGTTYYTPYLTTDPNPGAGSEYNRGDLEQVFSENSKESDYSSDLSEIEQIRNLIAKGRFDESYISLTKIIDQVTNNKLEKEEALHLFTDLITVSGKETYLNNLLEHRNSFSDEVVLFSSKLAQVFYLMKNYSKAIEELDLIIKSDVSTKEDRFQASILAAYAAYSLSDDGLAKAYIRKSFLLSFNSNLEKNFELERINSLVNGKRNSEDSGFNDNNDTIQSFTVKNYPNPFNPNTYISFSLPQKSNVRIIVYDILGREVVELLNERKSSGSHRVEFYAGSLSSGVYIYRIETDLEVISRKMTLLK